MFGAKAQGMPPWKSGESYAEGDMMPFTPSQQRSIDVLRQEHEAVQGRRPRDADLMDAMERDNGQYIRLPEEYGHALIYRGALQRISGRKKSLVSE